MPRSVFHDPGHVSFHPYLILLQILFRIGIVGFAVVLAVQLHGLQRTVNVIGSHLFLHGIHDFFQRFHQIYCVERNLSRGLSAKRIKLLMGRRFLLPMTLCDYQSRSFHFIEYKVVIVPV